MIQQDEYDRLYEQYSKKSNEDLLEIMNSENDYTKTAKKVACDVFYSDRTSYYETTKEQTKKNQKIDKDKLFFNLCHDIHSIKNMLLFFVILTILGIIFGVYTYLVTIPNLF